MSSPVALTLGLNSTELNSFIVSVEYKYGLNRSNRQTSRGDVPVAKLVQTEEEKRLQQEHFRRLEEMNAM
jgi:hypothetical protein